MGTGIIPDGRLDYEESSAGSPAIGQADQSGSRDRRRPQARSDSVHMEAGDDGEALRTTGEHYVHVQQGGDGAEDDRLQRRTRGTSARRLFLASTRDRREKQRERPERSF